MSAPSGDFRVDHEQIRAHAGTVAGLSDVLSATAGAMTGGPAGNALGTFLEFATAGLGDAISQAAQSVSDSSGVLNSVSRGLTGTAEEYQRADDDGVALLREGENR